MRGLRRALVVAVAALLGLGAGALVGVSTATHETTTAVVRRTFHETKTATVIKRKVIRPPARTVRLTVTEKILSGGDNAFDYAGHEGDFVVRGLQGYDTDYGPEILGQIKSVYGCDGYVELDATFYDGSRIVDTALENFTTLPAGSWIPFTISGDDVAWDTYDVVFARADCSGP
jgi:hypothetical protein